MLSQGWWIFLYLFDGFCAASSSEKLVREYIWMPGVMLEVDFSISPSLCLQFDNVLHYWLFLVLFKLDWTNCDMIQFDEIIDPISLLSLYHWFKFKILDPISLLSLYHWFRFKIGKSTFLNKITNQITLLIMNHWPKRLKSHPS